MRIPRTQRDSKELRTHRNGHVPRANSATYLTNKGTESGWRVSYQLAITKNGPTSKICKNELFFKWVPSRLCQGKSHGPATLAILKAVSLWYAVVTAE